jgi:hypothetical protein
VKLRNLHQTHYEPPKKPATNRKPLAPKNPQQPEYRKPLLQTHQHKTQQTNKTTKKFTKNTQSFRMVGLQIMAGEREARFGSR